MASSSTEEWTPDWVVPPGEILLEALDERSMTQSELARRLGRPLKTVNEIVNGKAAVTPETAIQLERALGISARFWINLEAQFREGLARQEAEALLEADADWAHNFPIGDMVKFKLIRSTDSATATLDQLLAWLGVSSPNAFDRLVASASYRSSPAFESSPYSVVAWLRWGELQATEIRTAPYDASRFEDALRHIRPLTRREPFAGVLAEVQEVCAQSGVAVVITPELSGTRLNGAVRWIGPKVVLQLSLRHRVDDQFWFTFYHEGGHVLTGRRNQDVVDDADQNSDATDAERKADEFARDMILPREPYRVFVDAGDFTLTSVKGFAAAQAIAAGLVAGRLEHDGHVGPGRLRSLKRTLAFPSDPSK